VRRAHLWPVLLFFLWGCENDPLQRMRHQPKYLPYEANPLFGDGRAMRTPPEGTVPRERLALGEIRGGGQDGGAYAAKIPIPVTKELILRGQKAFDIYCATCHGYLGDGVSMVASKMGMRPPPSLHIHRDAPGFYYEVITQGRGLMGSYANEIPPRDRWGVVAYVQALQRSQSARLDEVPPQIRQKLVEGAP
jgi:mono/diheme cytochrome c family protein